MGAGGRRLTFSTIFNVRDLGGYATPAGPTRFGRLLRSGDTMFLSDADLAALRARGVSRVADLRMGVERPELTDRFAGLPGVTWANFPMADDRTMTPEWTRGGRVVEFVVEGYRRMLADRAGIRAVISFVAAASDECVLFHCAGGMDRTGVVSMLVLGAVGVSREDLVADYAYAFDTDDAVDAVLASWDPAAPAPAHDGTLARTHAMFALYDDLVREHGSVRGYLAACGVTPAVLDALVAHVVG